VVFRLAAIGYQLCQTRSSFRASTTNSGMVKMLVKGRLWRSILSILLIAPASLQAEPAKTGTSPEAKKILNEAVALVFGNDQVAPPLVDLRKLKNSSGGHTGSCPKDVPRNKWYEDISRNPVFGAVSHDIICGDENNLDENLIIPSERDERSVLSINVNFSKDLSRAPLLRYSAQRYRRGYFRDTGKKCQLWLVRNSAGRTDMAIIRVAAKGPQLYDPADHQQQECLVRGKFVAFGLQGASQLPFDKLAYRQPYPVGLSYINLDVVTGVRGRASSLANFIFACPTEEAFQALSKGPFKRSDLVAVLSSCPLIDKISKSMAHYEVVEQEELRAAEPKYKPQPFQLPPVYHPQ
jgi:hypothetical protein